MRRKIKDNPAGVFMEITMILNNNIKKLPLLMLCTFTVLLLSYCGSGSGGHNHDREGHDHDHGSTAAATKEDTGHSTQRQYIHLTEEVKKNIDIKTAEVKSGPVKATLKAMGKVLAPNNRKAVVGFSFSGRVVKRHASLGDRVTKNQPLATLECDEVGDAQSEYLKSLTGFELTTLDFQREERLQKKDIGAKKDYLETRARYETAKAALTAAEKKLDLMGLSEDQVKSLAKSRNLSSRVTVKAPIAGRIVTDEAVLGAVVDPSTQLMTLLDSATLCIDADIYEKDIARIKKDQEVHISVPAYPGETFHGKIHYIGDVVHPETRTITVRTTVENQDYRLKPGMFADIRILLHQTENAMVIPKEAVLDDGDRKMVFVREDDHYVYRPVITGTAFNGSIEITAGLKIGDTVVLEGNYQLKSHLYQDIISHGHTH